MLKRIFCIVLFIFFTFGVSLNASAADRWQWIKWNDNVDVFVDVQTIEYDYGFTFSDNTPPAVGATEPQDDSWGPRTDDASTASAWRGKTACPGTAAA